MMYTNEFDKINKSQFTEKQLHEIELGFKHGIDASMYALPEYSHHEMFYWRIRAEIRNGIEPTIDELYNFSKLRVLLNPSFGTIAR